VRRRSSDARSTGERLLEQGTGADELALDDGSRVAIIGGGPAGSFAAFFLMRLADMSGLDLEVDVYEPRRFLHCGPGGCNHCGGIVSESLVQTLAAEGINLPPSVVQRGIESYVLHMDVGSVTIQSPVYEQRIASVYRGNGPRGGADMPWESFDGFLQRLAEQQGATIVPKLVTGVDWRDGFPHIQSVSGDEGRYDLVVVAAGVNSNLLGSLTGDGHAQTSPKTARTYIQEFHADRERIRDVMGNSMHVFLLDIPRLEFAAMIPKGDYITTAMLGHGIDGDLVKTFLATEEVSRAFPVTEVPGVCTCSPLINLKGPQPPYGDRLVMIGDSGVTRLYKDGIGAAFRTGKAAAVAAVLHGVSADAFRRQYAPVCRSIAVDNRYGKFLFTVTWLFRKSRFLRRGVLRMTATEQASESGDRPMSGILWNLFTGSAPYKEVFKEAIRPMFVLKLLRHLAAGLRPRSRKKELQGASR
jgi:flavin-dependent dehydrogenase